MCNGQAGPCIYLGVLQICGAYFVNLILILLMIIFSFQYLNIQYTTHLILTIGEGIFPPRGNKCYPKKKQEEIGGYT